MKHFPIILLVALVTFFCGESALAGSREKEISLKDLEEGSALFQKINSVQLPEESYDDRARETIISGYAVVAYKYNDNGINTRSGNETVFGQDTASTADFSFKVMEIGFTKRFSDHLWAATSFEIAQENEDGSLKTETALSIGEVHLIAPVGNGIDFTLGKFNSPVSFEQEDSPLLLQASQSLAFQFASPAKMVGLGIRYPFMENLETRAIVFNGWNQDGDNNEGKSLALQVSYGPTRWMDVKFSYLWGPELADNESDNRQVFDLVLTMTPARDLIIAMEGAYGFDERQSAVNPGSDAEWFSGQATLHYDFTKMFGGTLRYSIFDDQDGRPDMQNIQRRTMHEVTLSPTVHLSPGLLGFLGYGVIPKTRHRLAGVDLRLEYRYDWINESDNNRFFEGTRNQRKSTRSSFIAEIVVNF
ncbi:MAG: outer membrane beta-barrel protein [Nitrospinaceae bacterium]